MKAKSAIFALAISAMFAFSASAEIPADGARLAGIYAGSYLCEDGEHGVVLDFEVSEIEGRTELRINGTLGFVPVLAGANGEFADVAGSFTTSGFILTEPRGIDSAGDIRFRSEEWLVEPEGYGSANAGAS